MSIFSSAALVSSENKNPKVVIVGAGLAGLTTAYHLQKKGVDVQVYEARNRVGGRILTAKVGGYIAELGGQNIADGGNSENIYQLVKELELELVEGKINLTRSYFTGEKILQVEQLLSDHNFHPEELKIQLRDLAKKSQNMREVLNGFLKEEDPLYQILEVQLRAYEGGALESLSPIYAETLYHMLLGGVASVHQSYGQEEPYANLLSIKEGNARLPEALAEVLGGRLHLNKPLLCVSKNADGSFILIFQDGERVKADLLVLAIPCSVYAGITFEEGVIPIERLAAIKNVQYGANAKIIIPFTPPLFKIKGILNDHMVSFFSPDHTLLTLYYIGDSSRFSADTILHTYSQDKPVIERVLGDQCPVLRDPVFAQDQSLGVYEGPVGYSWTNDPYVKGTYSYIAPGQEVVFTATREEQGEIVKTLFAPIDQKLYFAGEHASVLADIPGTMEAACESGQRAARMILKSLGI